MSIFSRKKYSGYTQVQTPDADMIIKSFSQSVAVMGHSAKFAEAATDPEGAERKRLKGKHYDWLLSEKRDAVFDADARTEINFLKNQLANNQRLILPLMAKQKGELEAAKAKRKHVENEIAHYDRLEKELTGEDKKNEE